MTTRAALKAMAQTIEIEPLGEIESLAATMPVSITVRNFTDAVYVAAGLALIAPALLSPNSLCSGW
jgi:hypothetical protein